MQDALRGAGLRFIDSYALTTLKQAENLAQSLSESSQYVVKPMNSAASDGVVFATGRTGVGHALVNAPWGQRNDLGEINAGFLIQPFIEGPEYVVDMVAFDGRYTVASLCRYKKIARNGGAFVYEHLRTLNPSDAEFLHILNYARRAADALDIRFGPIHMEIIDSMDGPVMVEAGARMHGGIAPLLFDTVYHPGLISLTVDQALGHTAIRPPDQVSMRRHGLIGFFYSDVRAEFTPPPDAAVLKAQSVPGYLGHKYFVQAGAETPLTIDFATCPGLFWLENQDPEQLMINSNELRRLLWPPQV